VKAAKARGIPFVMINTNGKRIAHDDRFLEQLNEVRPSIYFQFDVLMRRPIASSAVNQAFWKKSFARWIDSLRLASA
jgi:uncharacterized radical SAM superfamily Fe-S cluster-containing enzyme